MISLYGKLARMFTDKYNVSARDIKIKTSSVGEVVRSLEANFPGFKQLIKKSGCYRITNGKTLTHGHEISEDNLGMIFNKTEWHIMPVAAGCGGKNGGLFSVVIGVILIAASWYIGGAAGFAYLGAQGYGLATFAFYVGVGMVLSGLSSMLTPTLSMGDYGQREAPEEKPSYLFNGPVNTMEPGLTLPLVYGETYVGSIVVSGSLKIQDVTV